MSDEGPLLERLGVAYLRWRAASAPPRPDSSDEVHVLNEREQATLRRIERAVVIRAGIAGALSALASALAERWAEGAFGEAPAEFDIGWYASFWGVVMGVTLVATIFEILFLYQDALEGVHRLSHGAGLELFDRNRFPPVIASALARAALELPNPLETPYHIDPHREVSKPRLLLATLLYKLKIGITSFLLKMLLRRLLTRATVRVWLVFVAVPVTAIWNAIVAFRVIREARVRAIGPSAARDLSTRVLAGCDPCKEPMRIAALRAVGTCVVSSIDLHPNLSALLDEVRSIVGEPGTEDLGDRKAFLAELSKLPNEDASRVVELLGVAGIIDGRLSRRERLLYREARLVLGAGSDDTPLRELARTFIAGRPIDDAMLRALSQKREPDSMTA